MKHFKTLKVLGLKCHVNNCGGKYISNFRCFYCNPNNLIPCTCDIHCSPNNYPVTWYTYYPLGCVAHLNTDNFKYVCQREKCQAMLKLFPEVGFEYITK